MDNSMNLKKKLCALAAIAFLVLLFTYTAHHPSTSINENVKRSSDSYCFGSTIEIPRKFEPSGVIADDESSFIFVVSDNGKIIKLDGADNDTIAEHWKLGKGYDLESVALFPGRKEFLYLAKEYPATIIEFSLLTGIITREFEIQKFLDLSENHLRERKPNGIESMFFINDTLHVGRQEDAKLFLFSFDPLLPVDWLKFKGTLQLPDHLPLQDLSAITVYDGKVWMVFDKPQILINIRMEDFESFSLKIQPSSEIMMNDVHTQERILPFRGVEGIALVHEFDEKFVHLAIDPPRKRTYLAKQLLKFKMDTFFKCFKPT